MGPVAQSVKRLATGWTVRGSNPSGGRDFTYLSKPALEPTQPPVQWVPGLSRGKERQGRDANPSPPSSAVGHERVKLYLYSPYGPYGPYRASAGLYLYSPYGPYGLYRASVELYLYSPYGLYGMYRASVEL